MLRVSVLFSCLVMASAFGQVPSLPADWGARHTWHFEVVRYFQEVAASSPRVIFERYGTSVEGRPLILGIVTSENNMARLADIREHLASLHERPAPADLPAVVWLGYGIHGDELSSTEAAIKMLRHLATDESAETKSMRENSVVVIDPSMNPDGRDRFVSFYRGTVSDYSVTDPQAMEHNQDWPSGRTNHFLFDLNRDWFLLSQDESRARVKAIRRWSPQVFVDHHEMGADSSYFFPPPAKPIAPHVPKLALDWWEILGTDIAKSFDERKWSYWTKEIFDLFYPGYGGSWPCYFGAVGMTFEQASARGRAQKRSDGSVITLRDASEHHFAAGLATVRTSAARRADLLRDVRAHYVDARKSAAADAVKGYVLTPRPRPDATARLVEALLMQDVEVRRADAVVEVDGLVPLAGGKATSRALPPGTFIVPADQKHYHLVKTLFSAEAPMKEEFLAADRARLERGESSFIYDVTAWNMAMTYGVESYALEASIPAGFRRVDSLAEVAGEIDGDADTFAYLVSAHAGGAARILPELARRDITTRIATFRFENGGASYPPGSVIVLAARNDAEIATRMEAATAAAGVRATATRTGRNSSGFDLGSNKARPWVKPKIAVIGNRPASAYSFGSVRYYLERVIGADYVSLHSYQIERHDLHDYNVIVIPNGGDWARWLGSDGQKKIETWVESGGTLVTLGGGATFLGRGEKPWLRVKRTAVPAADRVRGPLVRLRVKVGHWLGYGLPREMIGQLRSADRLKQYDEKAKPTGTNAVLLSEAAGLRVSGLMSDAQQAAYARALFLGLEAHGSGQVIVFAEDVLTRANMVGTMPLFGNAVMLGPTFR